MSRHTTKTARKKTQKPQPRAEGIGPSFKSQDPNLIEQPLKAPEEA